MVTEWQERLLLQDVMDGLAAAVLQAESEGKEVDIDRLDSIKLNKLVYLAIETFDVPITYSWYLYGASVSDSDVTIDYVMDAYESDVNASYEPTIGNEPWEQYGASPREYKEFFLRDIDLENIFREKTKAYLEEFYRGYAPSKYEDLYVASAVFQKSLDTIGKTRGFSSETPDLEIVLDELTKLAEEVKFHEEFEQEVIDAFTLYTDLLKDVLVSLPDIEDWDARKQRVVYDVCSFFYTKAWKFVAIHISEDMAKEVKGPSWRELLSGVLADIDDLSSSYEEDFRSLERRCYETGILSQEFRRYSQTQQIEEDYSQRADEDMEMVKEWEPATKEANDYLDDEAG